MLTPVEDLPPGAIGFIAEGRITSIDRETVLEPTLQSALKVRGRARLLYVAGSDFTGYDRGCFYDDAVFGTQHFTDFEKIAFVADDGPLSRAVGAMAGLMPGAVRVFSPREVELAKAWLAEEDEGHEIGARAPQSRNWPSWLSPWAVDERPRS